MARQERGDELSRARRTTAGRVWVALAATLVFLILLIVFIAENGQQVEVSFLGATGHISLALALLAAAVAGALVVLLAGTVRILQLRIAEHRHARRVRGTVSAPPAAEDEPETVQTQDDAHDARP